MRSNEALEPSSFASTQTLAGPVVLAHRVLLVLEVNLDLLLDLAAQLRLQIRHRPWVAVEDDNALDQTFRVLHLLHRPPLRELAQTPIATVLADLRLRHILHNRR